MTSRGGRNIDNESPFGWGDSLEKRTDNMAREKAETLRYIGERIQEEMQELGMLPKDHRVVVEMGTKTYGRAFRIYTRDIHSGGLSDHPLHLGDGFLGMTSGEALQSLRCIYYALHAARLAR